jgi:hypothetical protein
MECGGTYISLAGAVSKIISVGFLICFLISMFLFSSEQIDVSARRIVKLRFLLGTFDRKSDVPYASMPIRFFLFCLYILFFAFFISFF